MPPNIVAKVFSERKEPSNRRADQREAVLRGRSRPPDPARVYFAYGSNLNKRDWNENGFRPPYDDVFEKISVAWLPDHAHAFSYRSGFRNGGVLDVVPKEGCVVQPGAVWESGRAEYRARAGIQTWHRPKRR